MVRVNNTFKTSTTMWTKTPMFLTIQIQLIRNSSKIPLNFNKTNFKMKKSTMSLWINMLTNKKKLKFKLKKLTMRLWTSMLINKVKINYKIKRLII